MSVKCKVVLMPGNSSVHQEVEFSRVPCIGEYLHTTDQVFKVEAVYHALDGDRRPIVRAWET